MQGDGLGGVPLALSAFQRAQGCACQEALAGIHAST